MGVRTSTRPAGRWGPAHGVSLEGGAPHTDAQLFRFLLGKVRCRAGELAAPLYRMPIRTEPAMPPANSPSSPGSPGVPGAPAAAGAPLAAGPAAARPAGSANDAIDALDGKLIRLLAEEPRIGVLECSRRLQVARGTVQARLDRLQAKGVIGGFGPEVDPAALGYPVTAFATLEISQGQGADVRAHLSAVPEVLELHTITGHGDMMVRIVARSNADLQRVIDRVVGFDGIVRSSTAIALENPVPYRILPLVDQAAAE
ncbi:hypothetical protein GCM10010495_29260 [Kitasatospora herbaricolor]|nr:hypothetical protein GCM10010495_29260 [Kitasatospora herbaricolor]